MEDSNERDDVYVEPTLFEKVLAYGFIALCIATVLVVAFNAGVGYAIKAMRVSFLEYGDVLLEFYGFTCPEFFYSI